VVLATAVGVQAVDGTLDVVRTVSRGPLDLADGAVDAELLRGHQSSARVPAVGAVDLGPGREADDVAATESPVLGLDGALQEVAVDDHGRVRGDHHVLTRLGILQRDDVLRRVDHDGLGLVPVVHRGDQDAVDPLDGVADGADVAALQRRRQRVGVGVEHHTVGRRHEVGPTGEQVPAEHEGVLVHRLAGVGVAQRLVDALHGLADRGDGRNSRVGRNHATDQQTGESHAAGDGDNETTGETGGGVHNELFPTNGG